MNNIAVLVKVLGQRQELIGREEGGRRHRYHSSAGLILALGYKSVLAEFDLVELTINEAPDLQ
jgi:hypothetical protein